MCNVQRFLYSRWSSPEVQSLLPDLPYRLVEGENDGVAMRMTIAGKLQTYKPAQLVGILMGQLKHMAEAGLGEKITNAVVAVPADFDMEAEGASPGHPHQTPLKAAAALAGLSVKRIVRGPVAILVAYGSDRMCPRKVVVLDMGGETLQISAWEAYDGDLVMLNIVTRPFGGRHFDERVVEQ